MVGVVGLDVVGVCVGMGVLVSSMVGLVSSGSWLMIVGVVLLFECEIVLSMCLILDSVVCVEVGGVVGGLLVGGVDDVLVFGVLICVVVLLLVGVEMVLVSRLLRWFVSSVVVMELILVMIGVCLY